MKNQNWHILDGLGAAAMLGAAVLSLAASVAAGEPVPAENEKVVYKPMTWRPFKEVPKVLFYEGFESQPSWIKTGKFSEEPQAPSGKGVLNLLAKEAVCSMVGIFPIQFKIPSGLNPKDITVQVAMYSEEAGTVTIKFKHSKGTYLDTAPVPKVKGWGLVTMKLSDMMEAKKRAAEPDQIITEIDITVKPPKSSKTAPKVMIDDLIFTLNANPLEVKGRLVAAEKKRIDMEKTIERDGYQYSMKINDFLKEQLKPFKGKMKVKSVLVAGADAEQTELWIKSLNGAPKAKESGFSFSAFDGPDAAEKYIDAVEHKAAGGDPGYAPASTYWYTVKDAHEPHRLTAIGCLCRQFLGWKKEDLQASVEGFVAKGGVPNWGGNGGGVDLYYWYYGTLCVFQQGGDLWKRWNESMKTALVTNQRKDGDDLGSWDPVGSYSTEWGRVGQTALGALCLEVYYRYQQLNPGK